MATGNTFLQAVGLGNQARLEEVGSTNLPLGIGGTPSGAARDGGLRNTINKLLGDDITLNTTRSVDLDRSYASAPQAAMGLTVAVSGRATVVNADVATHLAEFQDPIKSLLGVALHRDHRVIIKRRYVQGGEAQVIPERAPGRTVSVRTEEREVVLARYGGDIEMSTNLLQGEPELAAADLNLKLNFQKQQLDRKLVDLGYAAIMETATDSARALLESMPNRSSMGNAQAVLELENIRARVFFGAFEKYEQPLMNLLSAAKRGAMVNADPYDTIIVPAGLPDLHAFSRGEARHYYLNGTPDSALDGVKFELGGSLYDAPSGLSCFVTHPKPSYASGGTLRPRMSESPLYRKRTVALWYAMPAGADPGTVQWLDFDTGEWTTIPGQVAGAAAPPVTFVAGSGIVKFVTLMMSSAIIGKGGSDTGELIVAYPLTSVHSIETSPEMMKMQLRCHMGAAVYRPENIQVLPDVHCEGYVGQYVSAPVNMNNSTPIKILAAGGQGVGAAPGCERIGAVGPGAVVPGTFPAGSDMPGLAYRGAVRYKTAANGEWLYQKNNGHLGDLDSPAGYSKLRGHNIFSRTTLTVNTQSC